MRATSIQKISELQRKPKCIRNICILAHVDHGKTTLADALIASNGIISQKMAGKLRYLDSREDEQIRGITMKASAISLFYEKESKEYLVNLIDSPGHVDFSSEVSTAVRLCDGAVVVVDVVEGVCPQTHAVLRQAWLENIKPVLVLNKIDRLILELKMEPLEAFIHLQQTLEQVNLVTSELFTTEVMEKKYQQTDGDQEGTEQTYDWTEDADEFEERNIYFCPTQGNVVFASAYDGWGFTIHHFAELFAKKLGVNSAVLEKTLWGDFYLNSKMKRIQKGAQSKAKKPLFVQVVLENIWAVYDAVMVRKDKEMIEKIIKSLDLKISSRDSRHNDSRVQLQAIISQWLPVSSAVLSVVVEKLPSPLNMSEEKVEKLMCSQSRRFDSFPVETQKLKKVFMECDSSEEAPVILFVSKMFPVEKKALPQNRQRPLTGQDLSLRREQARLRHAARLAQKNSPDTELVVHQDTGQLADIKDDSGGSAAERPTMKADSVQEEDDRDQVFIAFARVFSGTVRKGQKLYVLGPRHDPLKALEQIAAGKKVDLDGTLADLSKDQHVMTFTTCDLYLFMGRELEELDCVPAGNVLGLGGLEDYILKSGTVSSTVACTAFTDLYIEALPIVRVAIEPKHAGEMDRLVMGLRLLNQADPCVQVLVQETGEHVIITAGEIHLQRCLEDLRERYAKIEINVSEPIVPFRETIVPSPKLDMVNEAIQDQNQPIRSQRLKEFEEDDEVLDEGLVQIYTPNKKVMVQIKAVPLPPEVTDILDNRQSLRKTMYQYSKQYDHSGHVQKLKLNQETAEAVQEFRDKLDKAFCGAGKEWKGLVDNIWAFGPRRVGPNILINGMENLNHPSIWSCIQEGNNQQNPLQEFDQSVVSGFQLATLTGPLCDEPMRGVCFIVKKLELVQGKSGRSHSKKSLVSHMSSCLEGDSSRDVSHTLTSLNSEVNIQSGEINANDTHSYVTCYEDGHVTDGDDSESSAGDGADRESMMVPKQHKKQETYSALAGQLISCVKDGCRKAFQTCHQRLMVAMYKCNIQATTEVLGKLYAVIGKRNGQILSEDLREGSQMFNIKAFLPVVESFGLAETIRKKTSGLASPQLVFSHWELMDMDPFWVPTTEEEIMHYGEKADSENRARHYMNSIRKRKGMKVDEKIVEHAEKQRTLTKNK
ncbi:hypothetical protein CHS0354_029297 [Potamilus streckersoni]|uniref:Ribosome assembly protein 1 n=1 Tax=Potamilus streckersoni TaxID=2493646 RepID=A0AAE0SZK0_9BIVA|nr:hypothetical protein CHS0354_029297 [Potamilus streckersoni]